MAKKNGEGPEKPEEAEQALKDFTEALSKLVKLIKENEQLRKLLEEETRQRKEFEKALREHPAEFLYRGVEDVGQSAFGKIFEKVLQDKLPKIKEDAQREVEGIVARAYGAENMEGVIRKRKRSKRLVWGGAVVAALGFAAVLGLQWYNMRQIKGTDLPTLRSEVTKAKTEYEELKRKLEKQSKAMGDLSGLESRLNDRTDLLKKSLESQIAGVKTSAEQAAAEVVAFRKTYTAEGEEKTKLSNYVHGIETSLTIIRGRLDELYEKAARKEDADRELTAVRASLDELKTGIAGYRAEVDNLARTNRENGDNYGKLTGLYDKLNERYGEMQKALEELRAKYQARTENPAETPKTARPIPASTSKPTSTPQTATPSPK